MNEKVKRRATTAIVAGVAVAVTATWLLNRDVRPTTVEGWAWPNSAGNTVWLTETPDGNSKGDGFILAGARWTSADNLWRDGSSGPTCVGTNTMAATHVRLGVVDVQADGMSWRHAVWLRCL
ncbi:hypothetical protein DL991_00585 [Amycolatopsis sp. WAC 01375]|uniref:hypothetical protein n=1 Tax=Amycolatopsis sp. WAC 01375 TaxID=2203194 RepID=UPI000F7703B1|nr:hypothetical protein [Amycolatopsis sp. WAC 01375]RSM84022.1 hypothetical protein DL991_00585 [Amycolatopsis sp. WAC 01375]RSN37861.1 hypothetical protein DL990_02220 [Amycolatopsis sp. WAC 01416]